MPVRAIFVILGIAVALIGSTAAAKNNKVEVCHQQGNGGYHINEVNENALDAHLGHGDWLVEDEICGDEIDNDCDGDVDEDCAVCPCFTREDLDFYWPDNAPTSAQCTDYLEDDGYWSHTYVRVSGYETVVDDHQGNVWALAETWGTEGNMLAYCKFDSWYRDYYTWDYFDDYVEGDTTLAEYEECDAILFEFAEDTGLVCN